MSFLRPFHRRRGPGLPAVPWDLLFLFFPLFSSLSAAPPSSGSILVLRNGRTYRGAVTRHESGKYLLPGGKVFVEPGDVAWFSRTTGTDQLIQEWWEGIRNRPDLEDAVLPLARFCLQEGRLKEGLRFAKEWGRFRGWTACLSKEFLILTDMKEGYARKVGARMDAALNLLRKEFPGARAEPYACVVRLFKEEADFLKIAEGLPLRPDSSFYYPDERMIYLVDAKGDTPQWTYRDAYRVLCYHFLIDAYLGFNPKYTWVLVGVAACFENARYRSGKLKDPWRKHRESADRIRAALRGGTYTPLKEFFRLDPDRFAKGDPYKIHVAQAWSLVWFFRKSRKRVYRKAFFHYLRALKEKKDDEKALREAILPLGLDRLERDWKAFFGLRR